MRWRRDGENEVRREFKDKKKRQNSHYGAAQIGDSAAVVPLLHKHLNRRSPPANHGVIWAL